MRMRSLGWAWDPDPKTVEALKRGRLKYRRFMASQVTSFQSDLTYRTAHPRPSRDELDLERAQGEGFA